MTRYRDTSGSWSAWELEISLPVTTSEWDAALSDFDVDVIPNYQLGGDDVYSLAPYPREYDAS